MSQRPEQLASVIHQAVQQVITRGVNDPRVRGLISITKVELTGDLAEARVHVSVLPARDAELTMHGLRSAAAYIQGKVAAAVTARRMPRLSFRLDDSLKRQAQADAAISAAVAEFSFPRDEAAQSAHKEQSSTPPPQDPQQ